MRHGSPWYKRYPVDFLGGVQGLTTRQHAVYSVILELIYQHGGDCRNDPKHISGFFSDVSSSAVRGAIDDLLAMGKIFLTNEGKISQKRAENETKTLEKRREISREFGEKGAKKRWQSNENNDLKIGGASQNLIADTDTDTDTSSLRSEVKAPAKPSPRQELSKVLDDDRAAAVIDHRQKMRKPLTAHAAKLLAKDLAKWRDPNEAADEMIARGWQGFKPEWLQNSMGGRSQGRDPPRRHPPSILEVIDQRIRDEDNAKQSADDLFASYTTIDHEP